MLLGLLQEKGLMLTLVRSSPLGPRTSLAERDLLRFIRIEIRIEIGQHVWQGQGQGEDIRAEVSLESGIRKSNVVEPEV